MTVQRSCLAGLSHNYLPRTAFAQRTDGGMTVRLARSGSAEAVPVSKASQAAQILPAEPALCLLRTDEAGICRRFIVGILGLVSSAVGVHDASEALFIRLAGRKAVDPACLGCIRFPHTTSMNGSHPQAPIAADEHAQTRFWAISQSAATPRAARAAG